MTLARFIRRDSASRRGLSLGEMLVVLLVFLILAVLFFVSSRTVIVKTNASKARHEMREIDAALSMFHTTHSEYPTQDEGIAQLVGPQKSLTVQPIDPFNPSGVGYEYFSVPVGGMTEKVWILVSVGPDGVADFNPDEHILIPETSTSDGDGSTIIPRERALYERLLNITYDPTNGVKSAGDIFRFHEAFNLPIK